MYWFLLLVITGATQAFSRGLWEFFGVHMDDLNHALPVGDMSSVQFKAGVAAFLACALLTGILTRYHIDYSTEKKEERYKHKRRLVITYLVVSVIGFVMPLYGYGRTEMGFMADLAVFGLPKFFLCVLLLFLLGTLLCLGPALFARKPKKETIEYRAGAAEARAGRKLTSVSDRELFPNLLAGTGYGGALSADYISQIEQKKHEFFVFDKLSSSSSSESELVEKPHRLWTRMDRWLIGRLLGDGVVDSFPPENYVIGELYQSSTTTRNYYDQEMEDYRTDTDRDEWTSKIRVDYFHEMKRTLELLPKEMEADSELDDGSGTYALMRPVYRVLHPNTGKSVRKNLRSSAIWLLISAALVIGIQLWRNAHEAASLGMLPFIVQVTLLLVAIVALFIFLGNLKTYSSLVKDRARMGQYRKMADKNMPVIYRLLRYYHLWEKQTGEKYDAVKLMQEYFDAYLEQYYLK